MDDWEADAPGIVAARARFAANDAQAIATRLSGLLCRFDPGTQLTKTACFFVDRRRFLVAVGPQETRLDVDRALAYGLAWCGDRDLLLALPAGRTGPTLHRSAFLEAGIRVFSHEPSGVLHELAILTELDVVTTSRDPRDHGRADFSCG